MRPHLQREAVIVISRGSPLVLECALDGRRVGTFGSLQTRKLYGDGEWATAQLPMCAAEQPRGET